MTGIIFGLIVIIIAALIFIAVSKRKKARRGPSPEEQAVKAAGNMGEREARDIILTVLKEGDVLLNNVSIEHGGSPAEMDNIIVNRKGVFIIEVKYYVGTLVGRENDFEWEKYKLTDGGNVYEKKVKNPIVQVRRQEGILGSYLRDYGIDVWVKGYAYLLEHNSPIRCQTLLEDSRDIGFAIHKGRDVLSSAEVRKIQNILEISRRRAF